MIKVLLIGQTPPPYYGQSMMIKRLVDAKLKDVQIYHLQMSFSDSAISVGRFQFKKVYHLFHLIVNSIFLRIKHKINVLYYFPSGPNLNPILRDFILLIIIRPFFDRTILHFRAAGLSDYLMQKNRILQKIILLPYSYPDIAIQLSSLNPEDGKYVHAKKIVFVPNGIEDRFDPQKRVNKRNRSTVNILFVGALHKSKGIYNFIEAANIIREKNENVIFNVLGEFYDKQVEEDILHFIDINDLHQIVKLNGIKLDHEKWIYFYQADVFCFPTYFESESFGNVLLEAMMFELPIVGTKWRAIPELIQDNVNGLLVNPNDSKDLAAKLLILIMEPEKRLLLGLNGRKRYLDKYTLDKHLSQMNQVFLS
jgi:glycosyltransferase involved in cell wall biosynthesis